MKQRTTPKSLPPGGEGGAKRRMRAKSASGITVISVLRAFPRLAEEKTHAVLRASDG